MGPSKVEPHLRGPIAAYRAKPTPENADAFLHAAAPILETGLTTYGGGNVNPMMRTRARRVLLDSVPGYDPTVATFKTHAMGQLRTLQRYGAKQQQVISVPEGVALDQGHLRSSATELADRLGREPSDGELSDHVGLSRRRIAYIRNYKPGFAEGQLVGTGDEGDDAHEPAVLQPDRSHHVAEFLYPDLDPIDQAILESSLGLNGSPRLGGGAIARRLNLSPGAISQRKARIDNRLRDLAATGVL